jgi:hypothetical protein
LLLENDVFAINGIDRHFVALRVTELLSAAAGQRGKLAALYYLLV